jgi:hypothetical protein
LIFGPAVYDRDVLALDVAGLLQALAEMRAVGPPPSRATCCREIRSRPRISAGKCSAARFAFFLNAAIHEEEVSVKPAARDP